MRARPRSRARRAAASATSCAGPRKAASSGDSGGFLLGSVSHKVANLAKCTCITVK